jgi:hypothetical protein
VDHAKQKQSLITLGIEPTRPDTGYGYIEFDKGASESIRKVKSFREKPDALLAAQYLESGSFVWNAGIFIWKLSVILDAFQLHAPSILDLLQDGMNVYNTPEETAFIESTYPQTEKISVDVAIMERAQNVYTIPCDMGWSDLGTWTSVHAESTKDNNQNALVSKTIFTEDTYNSLILANPEKLVVVRGLSDFIIVDTDDCLLIYPKSEEQSIKELKDKLVFVRAEAAAQLETDVHEVEVIARDDLDRLLARVSGAGLDVDLAEGHGRQVDERRVAGAQIFEVEVRDRQVAGIALVDLEDRDQRLGIGDGHRAQQDRVDERENRRVRADAQGE